MKRINHLLLSLGVVLISKIVSVSTDHGVLHAIYISVVSIDHLPGSENSELCLKVFSDDLIDALRVFSPDSEIHSETDLKGQVDSLLSEFGNYHFKFIINGQQSEMTYLRSEGNGESTFLYYQMRCPKTWLEVIAQTNLLIDIFPDQKNIIRISDGPNQRYLNLSKKNQKEAVRFSTLTIKNINQC